MPLLPRREWSGSHDRLVPAGSASALPVSNAMTTSGRAERAQPYARDARAVLLGLLRAADMAVVILTAVLAYVWRESTGELPFDYWLAVSLGALLALNAHTLARVYEFRNLTPSAAQLGRVASSWAITILLLIATSYLFKRSEEFSRAWVILWYVGGLAGFAVVRLIAWGWIRRQRHTGMLALNIVVVGVDESAAVLAQQLRDTAERDTNVLAVFTERAHDQSARQSEESLLELTRRMRVDEVVIAMRLDNDPPLNLLMRRLGTIPLDVKLCPVTTYLPLCKGGVAGGRSLPMMSLYERPLAGWNLVVKRGADILLSGALLVTLLPLMLLTACVIAIDSPGPVLFRQLRYGFNNKPILIYKFRTMIHDAAPDPSVPQACRNDPRLTRVGGFLRRTSIDELPQLFNVLKGEMSLVGPRPHAVAHNEKYAKIVDDYLARHRVKPGITGWAQVNGLRGETATIDLMKKRVDYDLYYIANWSILFDFRIIILTILYGFTGYRAY